MSKSKSGTKASSKETKGAKKPATSAKGKHAQAVEPEPTVAPESAELASQEPMGEATPAEPMMDTTPTEPTGEAPQEGGTPVAEPIEGNTPPTDATPTETNPTPEQPKEKKPRGRFAAMSITDLQALYAEKVGRSSGSEHRGYLIWKIREAEKGRITVGPVQARTGSGEPRDMKVLPLSLETTTVEKMDAAWRSNGIKNRMQFLRNAIGAYLTSLGATEAAALFAGE